jgi:hypothetical protein
MARDGELLLEGAVLGREVPVVRAAIQATVEATVVEAVRSSGDIGLLREKNAPERGQGPVEAHCERPR